MTAKSLYPMQYKDIYTTYKSDKNMEMDVEMRDLGMASIKAEGSPSASDSVFEAIKTNYIHRTVALRTSITDEALQDNLYKTEFTVAVGSLKNGLHVAKDTLGANPLI